MSGTFYDWPAPSSELLIKAVDRFTHGFTRFGLDSYDDVAVWLSLHVPDVDAERLTEKILIAARERGGA